MDKRIRFSWKEKQVVARSVISGRWSIKSAANKYGCHIKTVQRWVGLYKYNGSSGLKDRQAGSYTGEFRREVISYLLKNHLSLMETAAFFGISNDSTVARWLDWYESGGNAGLLQKNSNRKKAVMVKKSKKDNRTSTKSVDEQLAALQSENEYLRAENAFLKKLDALIQEERAAKKQSRRQKPSKN